MARLTSIAAAFFLGLGAPACAQVDRWAAEISDASERVGIPEDWIRRVMKAESDGRTELGGAPITSRAGAMGLMQLMPRTWDDMRAANDLGSNPFDPHDNIMAGAAYLRAMYERFGYPGLFAAYNLGPRRYALHLATGSSLPSETIEYLRKTGTGARSHRHRRIVGPSLAHHAETTIFALGAAGQGETSTGLEAGLFVIGP